MSGSAARSVAHGRAFAAHFDSVIRPPAVSVLHRATIPIPAGAAAKGSDGHPVDLFGTRVRQLMQRVQSTRVSATASA